METPEQETLVAKFYDLGEHASHMHAITPKHTLIFLQCGFQQPMKTHEQGARFYDW